MQQDHTIHHRPIRSYVRREGRITPAQRRALDELWPRFGLNANASIDIGKVFGREAMTIVEVGFGNGGALLQMAQENPEKNYIGIDTHRPGAGRLLLQLAELEIKNVRVMCEDAKLIFEKSFIPCSIDTVLIFFPDPWHKKRHHKRRLIQTDFVKSTVRAIKRGGRIHIATDWQDYAEHIMQVLSDEAALENYARSEQYSLRP
ncbi:MAG: tRNA (guanosine(46)-N7)-methyltransferase TrmB, partial [Gammaproteobacteria bacterium]|nr:tRNA (guanosine(46)-N7)-methyltransferase TrmB [Gammaproteobacteria bacterium]